MREKNLWLTVRTLIFLNASHKRNMIFRTRPLGWLKYLKIKNKKNKDLHVNLGLKNYFNIKKGHLTLKLKYEYT